MICLIFLIERINPCFAITDLMSSIRHDVRLIPYDEGGACKILNTASLYLGSSSFLGTLFLGLRASSMPFALNLFIQLLTPWGLTDNDDEMADFGTPNKYEIIMAALLRCLRGLLRTHL